MMSAQAGFVPKYGQELSAWARTWAAGNFRGRSCNSHQEWGPGLFVGAYPLFRDSRGVGYSWERVVKDRERDGNGAF